MGSVVLFGIGSAIGVEYAETCKRLGLHVAAAVRNRDGAVFHDDAGAVVDAAGLAPELRALPCFCPLFTPRNRYAAVAEATALGCAFSRPLVDPTAIVASNAAIGAGSFVNAGCVIGAFTVLAEHVVVNRSASIGHHVEIAAFASVGPGAVIAGDVRIGRGAMVGAGAIVLPAVRIGAHAVVGAGAVVTADVPARAKVFGAPARVVATDVPELETGIILEPD